MCIRVLLLFCLPLPKIYGKNQALIPKWCRPANPQVEVHAGSLEKPPQAEVALPVTCWNLQTIRSIGPSTSAIVSIHDREFFALRDVISISGTICVLMSRVFDSPTSWSSKCRFSKMASLMVSPLGYTFFSCDHHSYTTVLFQGFLTKITQPPVFWTLEKSIPEKPICLCPGFFLLLVFQSFNPRNPMFLVLRTSDIQSAEIPDLHHVSSTIGRSLSL